MTGATQISSDRMAPLSPTALALAFGTAGLLVAVVFGALMAGMWGMGSAGWMHGSAGGSALDGSSMMGGGFGFLLAALVCGFLGGALAGGVSATVYNAVIARSV